MLSSQQVIGIVIAISLFFAFIFNYRRFSGIKTDTRLHLKQKKLQSNQIETISSATLEASEMQQGIRTKSLNVLFMYNGHSFEAHEILGLPAGSSWPAIEQAYQKTLKQIPKESREFLDKAYYVLKIEHKKMKI